MKVTEMLDKKYREWLQKITKREWENIQYYASAKGMHPAEYMYMCLAITEGDIKANGGYGGELFTEIDSMHKQKMLASNKHRQEHGHITKYWLTKKGLKQLAIKA